MEIICYLSNGYPTIEASYNMAVEYADAGCRMMEVDFPSRNPYLESDYIAGRMKKALEACDDYEKYMDSIVAIQKRLPDVKILVLAYENTVEEIGVDRFIEFCLTNNLKDILLVGLKDDIIKNPYEIEFTEMDSTMIPQALDEFDYAVITGSIVYNAGIDASSALLQEDVLEHLLLQVVVKEKNKDTKWAKAIVEAYRSKEFKEYLDKNNNGLWYVPSYN